MPGDPFDVRGYAATAHGTLKGDLHVAEYGPLDPAVVVALRYLARRQSDATGWLSRVLVTPTHKEARITAFLSGWAYERHWVAEALSLMAGPGGPAAPPTRPQTTAERLAPLTESVVSNLHGRALTAVHMTERLIDTWLVELLLARVAALAADPALMADVVTISALLQRQQAFFAEAADERLRDAPRSQRLTRRRLLGSVWPLAAEREPASSTAAVLATLFAGDPEWATALDARIDALPGLAGLHLTARSAGNPGTPALRRSLQPADALGRAAAGLINRRKRASAS